MKKQYYHGSASSIQLISFKGRFVGSGDGALTFGWGIYVTESKAIAKMFVKNSGKLYKVSIPDENTMLDWDANFNNQTSYVLNCLKKMNIEQLVKKAIEEEVITDVGSLSDYDGKDIYGVLASLDCVAAFPTGNRDTGVYTKWKKDVSMFLLKHGITGIKYQDVIDGLAKNYVIFDPRKVIIEK